MPASESGVEPMMVLSRMSICACTRTWSVTLSVGSSRKRMFAPPMFFDGQLLASVGRVVGAAGGRGQSSGTGKGGSP